MGPSSSHCALRFRSPANGIKSSTASSFTSPFKSKIRLEAENAVLRHQLIVLQRKIPGRIRFTNRDRLFFTWLYRWFPPMLDAP